MILNKKTKLVIALMLVFLGFTSVALASVTISGTSITGDSSFNAITGVVSGTIDLGSTQTLSLQTTGNGPITTGTGLVTLGGGLNITGTTSTNNLTIPGLATSGSPCLVISNTGVVSTAACSSGGSTIANTTNLISGNGNGNGSDSGIAPEKVLSSSGVTAPLVINTARTYYVAPQGVSNCIYNSDGGTTCTPSDSNTGLTKATPFATIGKVAAVLKGSIISARVTVQLANATGANAYQPVSVEFEPGATAGSYKADQFSLTAFSITDTYPTGMIEVVGDTTTPSNVIISGSATPTGTTNSALFGIIARNTNFRLAGVQGQYYGGGVMLGFPGALLYTVDARSYLSNVKMIGQASNTTDSVLVLAQNSDSTVKLGPNLTTQDAGVVFANMSANVETITPDGVLTSVSTLPNYAGNVFVANEHSNIIFYGSTSVTASGNGAYNLFTAINGGTISANADKIPNMIFTVSSSPNATLYLSSNQGSVVTVSCGATFVTCNFSGFKFRSRVFGGGVAGDISGVSYLGDGTSNDVGTASGNINYGGNGGLQTGTRSADQYVSTGNDPLAFLSKYNGLNQIQIHGFGPSSFQGVNIAMARGNGSSASPSATSGTNFNLGSLINDGYQDSSNFSIGSAYRGFNPSGTWSVTNHYGAGKITSVPKNTTTETDTLMAINGHPGFPGNTPTISACGTGATISAGSSDAAGEITVGTTTTTSCAVTFGVPFGQESIRNPICVASVKSGANYPTAFKVSGTTSTLTLSSSTLMDGDVLSWYCVEPKGN